MRIPRISWVARVVLAGFALAGPGAASVLRAQSLAPNPGGTGGWQRYDWIAPASSGTTGRITATDKPAFTGDPFTVLSQGSAWQDNVGFIYTQPVEPGVNLAYEASQQTLSQGSESWQASDEMADDLSDGQKASLQFAPADALTFGGNVHTSTDDTGTPASGWDLRGTGASVEGRLPGNATLDFDLNEDTTTYGTIDPYVYTDDAYNAQWKQPLGKLPLTAVVAGHYEQTTEDGSLATRLPSLEQSLVWKPADNTTLQMGLRQQHYQDIPGITNELNEAVFADWAQTVLPDVTWHSYAEVLNTRGSDELNAAAVTPAIPGPNGTPVPDSSSNLVQGTSLSDETVTFATGPSFKLDRDLSASIEYSDRFDRNPQPGDAGQEQRLSVSLKGSF